MKKLVVFLGVVGIVGVGLHKVFKDNSTILIEFRNKFYFLGRMPMTQEYKKDLSVLDREMNDRVAQRIFDALVSEEKIDELARKLSSLPRIEE
jgi:hypothetical protein